jgi:hypothetical protein
MSHGHRCTDTPRAILAAIPLLLLAPVAGAQDVSSEADGVEITRDADALRDELHPRPMDHDVADTALVFTNFANSAQRALCVAYDKNGQPVGRAWTRVPPLGLRYILASDLSDGADFVGHAQCGASRHLKATSVFLGPGITDLPVHQPRVAYGRIQFPLVATY